MEFISNYNGKTKKDTHTNKKENENDSSPLD